jgi:uncharacterized membrane protein
MKAISKAAGKVMDILTANWDSVGNGRKIDNGTFMAVHVELVNGCRLGPIFSVAHYYEQNGDLMRDPDMEFIKAEDGNYYPISFWQDGIITVRDEAVTWTDNGEIEGVRVKGQAKLATFANTWMRNIKAQQRL